MTDSEIIEMLMVALKGEQERRFALEEKLQKAERSRDWAYDALAKAKAKEVSGNE